MSIWIPVVAITLVALLAVFVYLLCEKKVKPIQLAPALGALVGAVIGIALVEWGGWDYPAPVILMLLGLAVGQIVLSLRSKAKR